MNFGYEFYFVINKELLTLPITPEEVTIKSGSNNKTMTLINEGEINILKSPSLMEIEFEARFPMRQYPYSRWNNGTATYGTTALLTSNSDAFVYYFNKFTEAKTNRQPVRFSIVRKTPNGSSLWGTGVSEVEEDNLFSLEDLSTKESAEDGDDVIVSFKLKKYKPYGVKVLKQKTENTENAENATTSTSEQNRDTDNKTSSATEHKVKSGDTLWGIAKKYYGNGSKYTIIYDANKTVIENTAKKYGKSDSRNGHWIYPGTKLTIPAL